MAAVAPQETAITRVQNHVLEHLDEAFTVERMAGLANMSTTAFCAAVCPGCQHDADGVFAKRPDRLRA
jgi:hypothetical protein